jgi:hypothetical protein
LLANVRARFYSSVWRNLIRPDRGTMTAQKQILAAAIIIFSFNIHALRCEENQSAFDLALAKVKLDEKDLSITGVITLKNKTSVEYTIPYFLFGLRNPTILLTINGRETGYSQPLLEISLSSPTTVDPLSTIAENFSMHINREEFASAPVDANNHGAYKIKLQAKYRSVYSDFRSYFLLRPSPSNLWLGDLQSNIVELDFRPGK